MNSKISWGFQNESITVRTQNGLDDIFLEPLVYTSRNGQVFRCPIGATTDGFSVPRIFQNIIPATGFDWFSAAVHDCAYRRTLQVFSGVWIKVVMNRKECDQLILEAMHSQGVNWMMRWMIYLALRVFGGFAFKADRKG